jgi:uracil-DNA glycosylase
MPESLASISRTVVQCKRCPRLRAYCTQIARVKKRAHQYESYWGLPVPGFGDPKARLMIVGLAPAAHGGNRTGRMFTGDSSGDWLYEALHRFGFANQATSRARDDGLELLDCYITASARCAPPDNKPTPEELDNCRPYLEAELRALPGVELTVALGRIAYDAWWKAIRRVRDLGSTGAIAMRPPFGHGVEAEWSDGERVLCSYHPSRQNTNTGRLTREMWYKIFRRARKLLGEK